LKKDKTPFLLKVVRSVFPKLEMISPSLAQRYFIKIFFTPLKYPIPEKEQMLLNQAEKFSVQIRGKKIQCYSWGSGPVILLVHGWAGRPTQFRKIIEQLVQLNYEVVGFDGPAHGLSEGKRTNIREFEEALKKIYEAKGAPEAIITHSFGGGAVFYAASRGLRVKKLINIASPTIGDEIIKTYLRAINGSWKTGDTFKKYILDREGEPFENFTALHLITRIAEPPSILLVHDEDDKEVYISHAEALIEVYPAATLFRTKGLGHTRILKDESVARACVTFIQELRLQEY
jgi:pimeloyl-ACP methyl ester carboxylesterase